jgi:oligosaccharide repeat unit polymerase
MMATVTLIYLVAVYLVCLMFVVKSKDFLNPVHLFLLSMVPPYVLFYFIGGTELNVMTYQLYIITVTSFIIGYSYIVVIARLICSSSIKKAKPIVQFQAKKINSLLNLFLFIGLVGFVLAASKAFEFSQIGPDGPLVNLRYSTVVLGLDIGFPKYMLIFLQISILLKIINRAHNYKTILFLTSIWTISSMFTMARTELLLALSSVFAAYYLRDRFICGDSNFHLKALIISGFVFILGFIGIAFATKRIKSDLWNTFLFYYISPLAAFDQYVLNFNNYSLGWNTFYPFAKLLSILGFQFEVSVPYIPPGQPNVFTMMAGPYLDYGAIGLVIVPFFWGLVYAIIYRRVRKGDIYFIAFYSLFIFPLIMSFFAYQYSLASWLYYIVILFAVKIWELLK